MEKNPKTTESKPCSIIITFCPLYPYQLQAIEDKYFPTYVFGKQNVLFPLIVQIKQMSQTELAFPEKRAYKSLSQKQILNALKT